MMNGFKKMAIDVATTFLKIVMIREIWEEGSYTGGNCENEENICWSKMPVVFSYFNRKRVVPRCQSGSTFIFMYSGHQGKSLLEKLP